MNRRVVVTGLGNLNPIGNNVKEAWENAKNGVNGIDFIKSYDASGEDVQIAGELKNFDIEAYFDKKTVRKNARFILLSRVVADEAIKDSEIDLENVDKTRFGVFFGAGVGGLDNIKDQARISAEKGYNKISPHFIPSALADLAAGNIAIDHGLEGRCVAIVTACASGTDAIGEAFRSIKHGYHDYILAGGGESTVSKFGIGGFNVMRALNKSNDPKRASIPFDKERSGFVMGEGAGVLLLESLDSALARGAKIYAEIVGYGATCDANHVTAPKSGGVGAANAIKQAIEEGNIALDGVDYINAHGTSTPLNDKTETEAFKNVFGDNAYNINISSTKGMTGHLLGGAGGVEAVFCVNAITDGFIPPTINYQVKDEECDLNITPNVGVERDVKVAISTSLGFGGHNAVIAFKKYE